MNHEILYVAEPMGDAYRGEAIDKANWECVFKTPHLYPSAHIAQIAAMRLHAEHMKRQEVA